MSEMNVVENSEAIETIITHAAQPVLKYTANRIKTAIDDAFRGHNKKDIIMSGSIYQTLIIRFKSQYGIDDVTEKINNILQEYYQSHQDEVIKYDESYFKFIYDFMYGEDSFCTFEFDTNPLNDNDDVKSVFAMPMIQKIAFYLLPVQNLNSPNLSDGLKLLQHIRSLMLKKYDLLYHKSYLHIESKNELQTKNIFKQLTKKDELKRLSSKKTDIMLDNNEYTTNVIGKWA